MLKKKSISLILQCHRIKRTPCEDVHCGEARKILYGDGS